MSYLLVKLLKIKIHSLLSNLTEKELNTDGSYTSSSQNIFITILVCRLLSESAETLSETEPQLSQAIFDIVHKSVNLIKNEKIDAGNWSYWMKNSTSYTEKPYPPDLDDTFNAHYVLQNFDEDYFNSETLFSITQDLINTEHKDDGYNTWIKSNIEDIDPVVQVAVYKLLLKIKSIPDSFREFLTQRILEINSHQGFWSSQYYSSKLYIFSELSSLLPTLIETAEEHNLLRNSLIRCYKQCYKDIVDDSENSPIFKNILKAQIEINLGIYKLKDAISLLLIPTRNIVPEPIFIESISQDIRTFCYSRAIVLALYIKTLSSTILYISKPAIENANVIKEKNYSDVYNRLLKKLQVHTDTDGRSGTGTNSTDISNTEILVQKVFKGDNTLQVVHNELYDFSHGIKNCKSIISFKKIYASLTFTPTFTSTGNFLSSTNKDLNSIYLAVMLGWIAYTTYDSILDNELPTSYIPIANMCNLHMLNILTNLKFIKKSTSISDFIFQKLLELNTVDDQITQQSIQSQKSIGHCVGPICIFSLLAGKWKESDIYHLENYYANYLSLKQLSDDVHDWKEDISAKRKTYVTELILSASKNCTGDTTSNQTQDYMDIFTTSAIYTVYKEMLKQTDSAIYHLSKIGHHFKLTYLESKTKDTRKYVLGIKRLINEIELYNLYCYT